MMEIQVKGTITVDEDKKIYDYYGIDCFCPKDMYTALTDAGGSDVDIYINSGGGDLFAATEIYSAVKSYKGSAKIHVVGLAASAASLIMCAAKNDIALSALVMIHNVSSFAAGDHAAMAHESEVLRKADRAVCQAYSEKTGKSETELLPLMDKETWLTAAEAVELGLCDEIAGRQTLTNAYCTLLTAQQRREYENVKTKAAAQLRLEKIKFLR